MKLALSTSAMNINCSLIIKQPCRFVNMESIPAALPQLPQSTFSAVGCQLRESMSADEGIIMDALQRNERKRDAMFADVS